jgi:hypothetical protein
MREWAERCESWGYGTQHFAEKKVRELTHPQCSVALTFSHDGKCLYRPCSFGPAPLCAKHGGFVPIKRLCVMCGNVTQASTGICQSCRMEIKDFDKAFVEQAWRPTRFQMRRLVVRALEDVVRETQIFMRKREETIEWLRSIQEYDEEARREIYLHDLSLEDFVERYA